MVSVSACWAKGVEKLLHRDVPKEEKNSLSPTKNVLSRLYSLKQDLLWKRLFSKGSSFKEGPFTLIVLPHHEFKIGFSVPKRLFSKANQRNQIKRILREAAAETFSRHQELPSAIFLLKYGHRRREVPSYASTCHSLQLLVDQSIGSGLNKANPEK
mgnify:CR=1 FL=1